MVAQHKGDSHICLRSKGWLQFKPVIADIVDGTLDDFPDASETLKYCDVCLLVCSNSANETLSAAANRKLAASGLSALSQVPQGS